MTQLQAVVLECIPVFSSREWITFMLRAPNGDWIWGTEGQTDDASVPGYANPADPRHVDFVLVNLNTGQSIVIPMDTRYVKNHDEGSFVGHVALSTTNQKMDPQGNIWIPAANNHLFKVPASADTVIQLPQLQDHPPGHPELPNNNPVKRTPNDNTQYTHEFTQDGKKLITGTQSNWSPAIFQIDVATGLPDWVVHIVSDNQVGFAYAYVMAIDGNYIYVIGGKNPWNLFSINRTTKEVKRLATRPAVGNMAFTIRTEGITVTLDTDLGQPDNFRATNWLVDGGISAPYVNHVPPPFPPRDCHPYSNPLINPPQIDESGGMGLIRWKPFGSAPSVPWNDINFPVPHGQAIDNESMTILPNGDVLCNAVEYQGFWRYRPATKDTVWYGAQSGIGSRGPRLVVDGIVWIVLYPNGKRFAYDPTQPWDEAAGNPIQHANFHASGMKYPSFLVHSNGRLFCAGWREREGYGTGLGWYDIATGIEDGTYLNLNLVNPAGLLAFSDVVILSTTASPDPGVPVPPPDAQLILFTRDFVEIERQTVVPGMRNTGVLFQTATPGQIVGLVKTVGAEMIYLYDYVNRVAISTKTLGLAVGASWQNLATGEAYAIIDGILYQIDRVTLALAQISDAPQVANANYFVVTPTEIVLTVGPTLFVIER